MGVFKPDSGNRNVVDYPLAFIKGTFMCQEGCEITLHSHTTGPIFQTRSKQSASSVFKALIPLERGSNRIRFSCNHFSLQKTIIFEPCREPIAYVRAIYVNFEGHDGSFQAPADMQSCLDSACKRIGLAVRLLQTITAETIFSETGSRRTFLCAGDFQAPKENPPHTPASPASAAVWCVKSSLSHKEAQSLTPQELWVKLAREFCKLFPQDIGKAKWLAIASCTEYKNVSSKEAIPVTYEGILSRAVAHCALGKTNLRYSH